MSDDERPNGHPEPTEPVEPVRSPAAHRIARWQIEQASRRAMARQVGTALLATVAIVAAVVIGVRQVSTGAALDDARQQGRERAAAIASLRSQQGALATALDRQRHQFQQCKRVKGRVKGRTPRACRSPVAPPATVVVQSPARVVGPSDAQVAAAVAAFCQAHGACRGGPGRAGRPPTAEQVAQAVRDYCDARGQCRGPAGASVTGPAGASGADGPPGATGPGPSDEQVAAAVAAYCAGHGNCQGPAGQAGASGSPGATGPAGYPHSFTFTIDRPVGPDATYTCEPAGTSHDYQCTRSGEETP